MRQSTFAIFFFLFLLASTFLGVICFVLHNHTIDFSSLQQDVAARSSVLLDCHGRPWGKFELEKRKYVTLEQMPEHLIQAFLVTEDRTFFQHPGISFRGILRSLVVNLLRGKHVQGASTITQQLVRLKFLHVKKTLLRKIKEQLYAILVEREWSKEQILEAYLNNVYFGYGIYGVQAAAKRFWDIDVADMTLDQSATLASVMKSPLIYSPIHAQSNVFLRRNLILKMMHECQMISSDELGFSQSQPLQVKDPEAIIVAPHAKEMIRQKVEEIVGKDRLYTEGLTIQTTLDLDVQLNAQEVFMSQVMNLKKKLQESVDGGLLSVDSKTGAIRAMIGGVDFKKSKFNRAVQATRQMGSIFKIFVYGAALEQGLKFWDVDVDEPFEMDQGGSLWSPQNHNKLFLGSITRAYALSHSNNIVTIKTLLKAGIENVIDMARRCHIEANMLKYPSLALGCVDTTLLEVVGSFNVIVNHGCFVKPHLVSWVKDEYGQKIYKSKIVKEQAMSSSIASQIVRVLTFNIERLKRLYSNSELNTEAIGKSGTNNDSRTCLFCGATPELTTAVYIGCDQNESLGKNIYSSRTAFPIWLRMHQKIAKTKTNFYYDPQLRNVFINWKDGTFCDDDSSPDIVSLLA